MLRELRVIDTIVGMLKIVLDHGPTRLENLKPYMHITKVCQLCYRLLYFAVKDFPQNELFTSSWVNIFIYHACHTDGDNDVFAELTLETLLSNNEQLLDEVITEDTVHMFEDLMKTQVGLPLKGALCWAMAVFAVRLSPVSSVVVAGRSQLALRLERDGSGPCSW